MIKNLTKNTIIASSFTIKTGFGKIRGLFGDKICKPIVFNTRFGVHTFFLKFSIDIIIIDKNNKIVLLKKNLKPNRVLFWNPKFNTVIELPSKTLDITHTEKGDILKINL